MVIRVPKKLQDFLDKLPERICTVWRAAPSTFLFLHKDIEPLVCAHALFAPSVLRSAGAPIVDKTLSTGDGLWPLWATARKL
jgi:hypothetical protein